MRQDTIEDELGWLMGVDDKDKINKINNKKILDNDIIYFGTIITLILHKQDNVSEPYILCRVESSVYGARLISLRDGNRWDDNGVDRDKSGSRLITNPTSMNGVAYKNLIQYLRDSASDVTGILDDGLRCGVNIPDGRRLGQEEVSYNE